MSADAELFVDPVCPFCWVTSRWVRQVQERTDLTVTWRFVSLAVLNDRPGAYDDKPAHYPQVHHLGRELLRVAAAARDAHGDAVVGPLYVAMGEALWERSAEDVEELGDVLAAQAAGLEVAPLLEEAGLPAQLASARGDPAWDAVLEAETSEALDRVGGGVGTPVISLQPPDGPALFGPVISDLPPDDEAVACWEALTTLAAMPGFAEIKRSLRSMPVTRLTASLAGTPTRAG